MLSTTTHPRPNVLVVDDEPTICDAVVEALPAIARSVAVAGNTKGAISTLASDRFDVVLCDLCMPGGGGLEVLQHASRAQLDLGFILMTGKPELNDIVAACRLHAADILLKPFSLESLQTAVQTAYARVVHVRRERLQRSQLRKGLRHRAVQLEKTRKQVRDSYREIIEAMIMMLDHREHETCAHSFRVRSYATYLATEMDYPADELEILSTAALLHDIGKVAIPDRILLKPGELDPAETVLLQQHALIGEQIVGRSAMLQECAPIIRHHHERWDGQGYPDRLAGDNIPLGARLFALADTLDAMTSDRCYRAALSLQQVHAEVTRCSGQQFDPDLAQLFQLVPDHRWIDLRNDADAQAARFNPFREQLATVSPLPLLGRLSRLTPKR